MTACLTIRERCVLFQPDLYYTDVRAIDLHALRAKGVTVLLLDIDNTVSPHHSAAVVPGMPEWLASLPGAGFGVRFVSNNWHSDLADRAAALGFPAVGKAKKPLPFGFRRAAGELGVRMSECAVIGDQIFTDILGGNLAGAVTVLVDPLTSADMAHTRVLRRIERVIMRGRAPEA